jgi:hypothetical protein
MAINRTKTFGLLAIIVGFLAGPRVNGAILYQTGFEAAEGFVAGQPISGQNGWITVIGNSTATVSTTNPASGSQSLYIPGTDMADLGNGLSLARYRPDLGVFQVDPTVTSRVLFQAAVRLNGSLTPPPIDGDLVSANLTIYNSSISTPTSSLLGELYVSSDGDIWGDNQDNSYLFGKPNTTTGVYYQLGILIDFPNLTATAYVDGSPIGVFDLPAEAATTGGVRFDLSLVAVNGAVDFNEYSANFDNILVQSVPEPASLTLLSFGVVAVACGLLRRKVANA